MNKDYQQMHHPKDPVTRKVLNKRIDVFYRGQIIARGVTFAIYQTLKKDPKYGDKKQFSYQYLER